MPKRIMSLLPKRARRLFRITVDVCPETEDGGPGSGNWGHKGRPGQVGGSGKGGGKQYRGGRGDIVYTSSKRDWLNGLQGERQHEAQNFLKKMREHYNQPDEQGKSPEQLIMEEPRTKYGGNQAREKLLGFMAEARGWDEHAGRLIDEHWDDNDRKLATALANKYGQKFTGGIMVPDDSSMTDQWEDEDLRTWQDLKSKAMGGPTSGREAPDELQYEAGLKERPKPRVPQNVTEQDKWFEDLAPEEQDGLRRVLRDMKINVDTFGGVDVEGAERQIFMCINSGSKEAAEDGLRYYNKKDKSLGNVYSQGIADIIDGKSTNDVGNLPNTNAAKVAEFCSLLMKDYSIDTGNTQTNLELAETHFMGDTDVDPAFKRADLSLKATALGYGMNQYGQEMHVRSLAAYRRQKEERDRAEQEKKRAAQTRGEQLARGDSLLVRTCESNGVERREVTHLPAPLSREEIADRLGGGDETGGSCASLAIAYAANVHGFDVLDFRGGKSQSAVAKKTTLEDIAESPGVDGLIEEGTSDITPAKKLMKQMVPGKEYILCTGHHAAIVRIGPNGNYEYMELQSQTKKGYQSFGATSGEITATLKRRFGCVNTHKTYWGKYSVKSLLIDVERLKGCKTFENALPYINTQSDQQKKGRFGYEK